MKMIELDPDQARAVELICSDHRFAIITGGPGTGKTTILKTALYDPRIQKLTVALAAPTGKAAKRMGTLAGVSATTIHRLIGHDNTNFSDEPIHEDLVIVDESSMVDVEMLYHLMRALPPKSRLILIGDADQIPSVGAGSVLRDILDAKIVPSVTLSRLHRSVQDSWVCQNSKSIITGGDIDLSDRSDFNMFELDDIDDISGQMLELFHDNKAAVFSGQFQFLTPRRTGNLGTEVLNYIAAEHLNPDRLSRGSFEIADPRGTLQQLVTEGDRVIQSQNNYTLKVYNGEVGTVDGFRDGKVVVQYPDRMVAYSISQAQYELRLAYVLTVHKSQGSEWDTVVVLCHSSHARMWSRQLLYTAVTRAKKKVVLIADEKGLERARVNNLPRERFTTLLTRIREKRAALTA